MASISKGGGRNKGGGSALSVSEVLLCDFNRLIATLCLMKNDLFITTCSLSVAASFGISAHTSGGSNESQRQERTGECATMRLFSF